MPPMQQFVDNRYRLVEPLGSGGMADVYLAHDDILDRTLALKVLSNRYAEDEEFIERFRREAQNAASLSHPNIVSIYDRGETEDGTYYIAMEYLPGGTLKDRVVKRGPLPARTAAAVALQIAEALKVAHDSDVVHRDIKPHNILITESGDIKVTDFGIARAASSSTMTKTGSILGTAHYLSPEQAMGEPVRPQSDLYSLGVVLYELLTGKLPYDAETPIGIAMKHVNGELRPPIEVDSSIPAGINAVVMRLLARNPEDRYADAAALIKDLERVSAGLEPEDAGTQEMTRVMPPAVPPPPPRKAQKGGGGGNYKRFVPLVVLALLAMLVLGGLAWAGSSLFGGGDEPPAAMIPVPNLEGKTLDEATEQHGENFDIAKDGEEDSRQAENTILSQDPEPGAQREENSEIGVTVASGQNEVPGVKGQSPAEARTTLEEAGFEVTSKEKESDADQEGQVISQDPGGGNTADVGSTVELTVGTGVANVEVPDLSGMTLNEAEAAVRDAGLAYNGNDTAPSDDVEEGRVISQSVAAGESVEPGTGVGVRISTGPELISIPNLYGYTLDEAAAELRSIGLQLGGSDRAPDNDVAEGGIIGQSSAAGTAVEPGTSIDVTVSSGPEQTTVPDVAGDNLQEAQGKITDAGFTYTTLSSQNTQWPAGTVLYTDPTAGTQLESGSNVTIGYSTGPPSGSNNNGQNDKAQEEARKERQKAQEEARKERQKANKDN
ncbi:Stk1 family PASTA domain-containing Ser/Thr kinase [soil metagenome]